jgi:hypothetical protein
MTTTSSTYDKNNFEMPLELSDKLKSKGVIQKFVNNPKHNYIKIELINHKAEKCKIIISTSNLKDWDKFRESIKKMLNLKEVYDEELVKLIQNTVDDNHELIISTVTDIPQQLEEEKKERDKDYDRLIQKLIEDTPNLTFENWSRILLEKRLKLNSKINEYFPDVSLLVDFELSIKKILNIEDITLPFMGIVFAVPSSLKTAFFKLLRKLKYSYYSDKFTARAFVSHSATVAKEKLAEIDMLPQIKDKILLIPELSALFTGKDDDVREQFGIITRVLDGEGLETNSGVHGKRGYYGKYMFTWLGAAVDIPNSVYKFLSTIGFKIYFLRLPRVEVTEDELFDQLTSKKSFRDKMEEIENLMMDYLTWFEICPISLGQNEIKRAKIQWDDDRDDKEIIKIIARLALLLAHIRGHVDVYKSSDHDDIIIPVDNNTITTTYSEGFIHGLPIIENPSRAAQQLYNLARGHALSYGRNYITKDDVLIVIKVVLSTGSIERVLVLDLLIAHKGTLTTSQITTAMRISNDTAKKTMTEFKGLELVTRERTNKNSSNSEYSITLNPKFDWFLTEEFSKLRNGFKPTSYTDLLKSNKSIKKDSNDSTNNSNNKESQQVCCEENTPCVAEKNEIAETTTTTTPSITLTTSFLSSSTNDKNNSDLHKGENTRSKNEATVDDVLVKVSAKKKDFPIEMTKEQYDSWAGNENENEI